MAKSKLLKFSQFVEGLLPHEANYLSQHHKFEDEQKMSILNIIISNANSDTEQKSFDDSIDKRKYSYVKTWSQKLLSSLDVDQTLEKLLTWEQMILTDALTRSEEKEILKLLKSSDSTHFNFVKLYDISRVYRHYLQIRLRHRDFDVVHQFIHKYRTDYEYSKLVNDKLHDATSDIINHYILKKDTNNDWFSWLSSIFYNESLDGYNRLLAWIRLVFIAHNNKAYHILEAKFQHFEKMIENGHFYSRRILVNFYSQYVLYYSSSQDFKKATYYGYLSIKEINNDYLYYVNNLVAILLRTKKPSEAYEILKSSSKYAKESANFHNKIGHTSFTIFALIDLKKSSQAENHAFVFLTAYKKEIFDHRWHLFYTAYVKSMLINGNYYELTKLYAQNKLQEKDELYAESANYTPALPWMSNIALFKKGDISLDELSTNLSILQSKRQEYNSTMGHDDLYELTAHVLKNDFKKLGLAVQDNKYNR